MARPNKRQKLNGDGGEVSASTGADVELSHTKVKKSDNEKQSTLYIRGLHPDTTNDTLAEQFSQSYPVKHAVVVTDKETSKCKGFGFVTFVDHEDAKRALEEFHGSEWAAKKLNVTFAERRHREEGADPAEKKGKEEKPRPESSKLIIRNLPWSINSQEKLTKLFLSYGKINQAILPKDHTGRMKGFGVVMLRGRKAAERALQGLNGKEVDGRQVAVDWAADKEAWEEAQAREREVEKEAAKEAKKAGRSDAQEVDPGREDDAEAVEDKDASEAGSEGGEDDDNDDDDDVDMEDESADDDVSEDEADSSPPQRQTSNEAVLFIRNLPFTTTDEDLYEHFGALYPVRYARIVIDHATERPRGTGFVCFYKKEDADSCLREAPKPLRPQHDDKKGKKSAVVGKSILENEFTDPSGKFTLDGRVLQLTRAVDKSEAERLTTEGVESRTKRDRDKRRLYLLNEGTIPSNSPLYEKLSPSERAMRDASAKQRRKLVDSNPSLNISLTRLSIRNIPRSVMTSDLKALARQAIVGFATDIKEGKRTRLSKEELARDTDELKEAEKQRKLKKKGIVKQAKIIFEGAEGTKVDEGSGRSRGYGFVEYYTHRAALMGLRWLNGYAVEVGGSREKGGERKKRLIVEFAIENAQVVKRRQDREIRARENPKGFNKNAKTENGKEDGKRSGASGAARRVAEKEGKKDGKRGDKDEREKEKAEMRRMIAKKRRERKVARRAGKGKA